VLKKLSELEIDCCMISDYKNKFSEKISFYDSYDFINSCDVIIPVGGDGIMIHSAKFLKPVLGINAGRLAFMAGLEPTELELLCHLKDGTYTVDKRMMLSVTIKKDGKIISENNCLNDVIVARGEKIQMVEMLVRCNGKDINRYLADGMIIATPTGSTAYNLSSGGPVMDPQIESMLLTPICTHSLFARTLIFKSDAVLSIVCESDDMLVSCDGEDSLAAGRGYEITVTKSPFYGEFIRIKSDSFLDILNNKLAQRFDTEVRL
ncbi:MAG: NAD(+)/NADH kinase, partial [Clostridia bacterium]|nr:NAD(+)/NADH kinase [Clostridia bacterium]